MTAKTSLQLSSEAVLQTAIEILEKKNGQAAIGEMYEAFEPVLGHPITKTEAENIYEILSTSDSASCVMQPDGRCLYLNTADSETFTLENNPDAAGVYKADDTTMTQALDQSSPNQGYVPANEEQSDAVVEPNQLVKAGKGDAIPTAGAKDLEADAQAALDAAEFDKEQGTEDQIIDDLGDQIKKSEAKIARENEKIELHKEQIAKDRTRLMKDIHQMEIRHDQKVIDEEDQRVTDLEKGIINQ